jgi:SAM-dependent methyltransferase
VPNPRAARDRLPADLESAFYAFLGFSEEMSGTWQAMYADRFAGGRTVVDLACGRGEFLRLLRDRGIEGIGVDSDAGMVAQVRDAGLEIVESDALTFLDAEGPSYDGIYCSHFVEHLTPPQVLRLLGAVHRRLNPGGRFIAVTPNPGCIYTHLQEFWRDPTHVRLYSIELLAFLVTYSGFEVIETGQNRLRDVPREQLPGPAADAVDTVVATEDAIRDRIARWRSRRDSPEPSGNSGAPATPEVAWSTADATAPALATARARLMATRDRLTGSDHLLATIGSLERSLAEVRLQVTAAEADAVATVDHDVLRVTAALRNLQQVVEQHAQLLRRQLDDLYPSPEIFVVGVRRE